MTWILNVVWYPGWNFSISAAEARIPGWDFRREKKRCVKNTVGVGIIYGLYLIIMYHKRFINCDKYTTLL